MFKDYDKYLSTSLKVYIFVLIIVFILKLVGFDYFGLDVNNKVVLSISNFLLNTRYSDSVIALTIYIQLYLYLCIVCKKRHLYLYTLIGTLINLTIQAFLVYYSKSDWIYYICSLGIMIILPMIVNKSFKIKEQVKYLLLLSLYQLICLTIRNIGVNNNYNNFVVDTLLNIDQLLLLAITYNIVFMKGVNKICLEQVVGYSLQKKMNLKTLLQRLQKQFQEIKKLDKQSKLTFIIYSVLSAIWNIFTLVVIFLIAKLNDTVIECIFITTSFWIAKKIFGKAFHLKSMLQCFILSNITYYILNRITTPIGISILIPIMLGVGLSYITSKLIKKTYKPLYKGMSEELFNETILNVVDYKSTKYNICYEFYINKSNAVLLSMKYNYSEAGIRMIIKRVNDSIKALNK